MKTVAPTQPNYSMTNSNDVIKVAIHARQVDSFFKVVSGVALSIWVLLGVFLAFLLSTEIREFMNSWTIAIIPFILWVVFGAFIIGALIFPVTFQETITIDHEAIKIEYESWLFKKHSSQYLAEHIQGLRASPLPPAALWSGRIAFDYGGKTFYFGSKLNESEARHVLSTIKSKFGNYDLAK